MSRLIEVNNGEAVSIMTFLDSAPGQKLIAALKNRRPVISGKDMEERFGNSCKAEGWEACIEEMITIAETRNDPLDLGESRPINPSLDDDRREDRKPKIE